MPGCLTVCSNANTENRVKGKMSLKSKCERYIPPSCEQKNNVASTFGVWPFVAMAIQAEMTELVRGIATELGKPNCVLQNCLVS